MYNQNWWDWVGIEAEEEEPEVHKQRIRGRKRREVEKEKMTIPVKKRKAKKVNNGPNWIHSSSSFFIWLNLSVRLNITQKIKLITY